MDFLVRDKLWGVIVEVTEGAPFHLVEENGKVTCQCMLVPTQVILVEEQPMDNGIMKRLCKGSVDYLKGVA
jgi:hypothetical protein